MKKFVRSLFLILLCIPIISSCNLIGQSKKDLPEYMGVLAMQDGVLYGTVKTESGSQFASYDASGFVYLHGIGYEDYYTGDYVCCFAGKDNRDFYISICYNNEGSNLQKEVDLTEIAAEFNKTQIYRMTVEDDILFMNNLDCYSSIFIDIGENEPKLLLPNMSESESRYEESVGTALFQPISIYKNDTKNVLMFLNRETKQFTEYPNSDFGIVGRVIRVCVDRTGNVLIRSCDEYNEYHLYFGTLKNGRLTDVHPCQQSDLSFRLKKDT